MAGLLDYLGAQLGFGGPARLGYGTATGSPWDEQPPILPGYDPGAARNAQFSNALIRAGAEIASSPRGNWVGPGLLGLLAGAQQGRQDYRSGLLDRLTWDKYRREQQREQAMQDAVRGLNQTPVATNAQGYRATGAGPGASMPTPDQFADLPDNVRRAAATYAQAGDAEGALKIINDYRLNPAKPLTVAPGSTLLDPATLAPLFIAPDRARAPTTRDVYVGDNKIQTQQFNPDTGAWEPLGPAVPRFKDDGNGSPTAAQTANNAEIDAARKRLPADLSMETINKKTQPTTDTGMPNPSFDPFFASTLRTAMQHKVGDDPGFDQIQSMIGGGAAPATPGAGAPGGGAMPRDSSGQIDAKRLIPGATYDAGDGTLWSWDGSNFTQVQ